MDENDDDDDDDPSKPEEPSEADCCNSGCTPCVFDLYEIQLAKWKNKKGQDKNLNQLRSNLLSETKFKPFILLEKTKLTGETYLLKFQPDLRFLADGTVNCYTHGSIIQGILPYHAGQHFVMKNKGVCWKHSNVERDLDNFLNNKLEDDELNFSKDETSTSVRLSGENNCSDRSAFITRAYTPITLSALENNCCFSIVFKRYVNGKMSEYVNKLCVGDTVYFRGPYGDIDHIFSNSYKNMLMLCMGTGIAPVYTVVRQILSDESNETKITLLYGSRTISDLILRERIREFTSFWNFSVRYFISDRTEENGFTPKFGEHFTFSRIDETEIKKAIDCMPNASDCLVLICGTIEFNSFVVDTVLKLGINETKVHVF